MATLFNMNSHNLRFDRLSPSQLSQVNRFYKQCRDKARAKPGETVVVAVRNGQWIAALRLLPKPQDNVCLRSLCVAPAMRGQGTATALLHHVFNPSFHQICYCYAISHLTALYTSVGFITPELTTLPGFIRQPYIRYVNRGQKLTVMIRYPRPTTASPRGSALTQSATYGKTTRKAILTAPISCD